MIYVYFYRLLYLINHGLTFRNDNIYNVRNILKCLPEEQESRIDAAELSDISTIIVCFSVGVLLALIIFISETSCSRSRRNKMTVSFNVRAHLIKHNIPLKIKLVKQNPEYC